jgi:urease beta subunit
VRTALGSHYHYTDHATRDYKAFDRVAAGGERMWR